MKAKLLCLLVFLATGCIRPALGGELMPLLRETADDIKRLELFGNGLYWLDDLASCGDVRLRGTVSALTHTVVSACNPKPGEVTRDDAYIYYTLGNRRYRKAVNAAPNDPATLLQPGPLFGSTPGALTVWKGRFYWTESNATALYVHDAELPADDSRLIAVLNGPGAKKIVGFTWRMSFVDYQDALFLLKTDGTLSRLDINPGTGVETVLATGVTDFVVRNESRNGFPFAEALTSVFAVQNDRLAHLNLTSGQVNGSFYVSPTPPITAVAEDSRNLYVVEQPWSCFLQFCSIDAYYLRRILRTTDGLVLGDHWELFGSYNAPLIEIPPITVLRSDGQWLYCNYGKEIDHIRTDEPEEALDFAPIGLELVQTVQNMYNNVRLVANKPAVARAYGYVTLNQTGLRGPFLTSAALRGFSGGRELPGSPLRSLNNAFVDSTTDLAQLRPYKERSFLFDVPAAWMQPGLLLTLTINPNHAAPETGPNPFANNSMSVSGFQVVHTATPCLVLKAVSTASAAYDPNSEPDFWNIIERAKTLLPVDDFKIWLRAGTIKKPVVSIIPPGIYMRPFQFQQDKSLALIYTALWNAFDRDPGGCADTHHVGLVPASDGNGFTGIGGARGVKLSDLIDNVPPIPIPATAYDSSAVVCMLSGTPYNAYPWNSVIGGHALAHELGHNWGRFHIDQTLSPLGCPGDKPDRPWHVYPYDPCTLGPTSLGDPGTDYGFDPMTHSVILPTRAGDTMSYAESRWTSRFTWDALFGPIPVLASPAAGLDPLAAQAADPVMLVQGILFPARDAAELLPFYQLPAGEFDPVKVSESIDAATRLAGNPYSLRLLDGVGNVLEQTPVLFQGRAEGAAADGTGFLQFVNFPPLTQRVQFLHGNSVLAERWLSLHPPTLSLFAPTFDAPAQTLDLAWKASDADGDSLLFTVQFSPDNGLSWQTIEANYAAFEVSIDARLLSGSSAARLRVIATDGIGCALATTAPFTLPTHAPEVSINGVWEGQRLPFGHAGVLRGRAIDAEDGSLDPGQLRWNLAGPSPRAGVGNTLSLVDLSPGRYRVELTGEDSSDRRTAVSRTFEILPLVVPDGPAPVLDGNCADPAYANAAFVRLALGDGQFAIARLVHAGGELFVSFTDLQYSLNGDPPAGAGLRLDPNASGDSRAQANDLGFFVDEQGIPSQQFGNGQTMATTLTPSEGFAAVVNRGSNGWSAELRISDSLIGGWNHAGGLMLSHTALTTSTDDKNWPPLARPDEPSTWAEAYLGAPPPPANRAPVASAGPSRTVRVAEPTLIALNGSASFDPDGDTLGYAWTQVSGPSVTLSNAGTAAPSFTTPPIPSRTTLRFQLVVGDGSHYSSPAAVDLNLQPTSPQPLHPAGGTLWDRGTGVLMARLLWPGEAGERCVIEASSNLVDWVTVATNTVDALKALPFTDPDAKHFGQRFYRARQLLSRTRTIYTNDFEGVVGPEWSNPSRSVTPVGQRRFLGEFGAQTVSLALNNLPAHTRLAVGFDLFILKTWDGNDSTFGNYCVRTRKKRRGASVVVLV